MRDKPNISEEDIQQIPLERVHCIPTKKNTSQGQNSKPTMEDKNPWNGYVKTFFHILYISNVQM